jgi:hypothetical protein
VIEKYRVQIIPSSPSGMSVDVGANGIIDWDINYTLNSTTTPINYSGNDSGVNNYIAENCQSSDDAFCLVPIIFILDSGGMVEISIFNLTENINPISFDASAIQTLQDIPIKPTYTEGMVQVDDVRFDYRGSKNITVVAHTGDYSTSLNRTIFVKYSPFTVTLPPNVDYWNLYPDEANQSNLEPFGQNETHGFFRIDSTAYDGSIDIYVRYNESTHVCVTQNEFRSQNLSYRANSSIQTLNVTNLTTSNQLIIRSLNDDMSTTSQDILESETFEVSLGNWVSTGDAGCAWARDDLGTPSSNTGPCTGNSSCNRAAGGNNTDYYVYVETSSGDCNSGEKSANLTSSVIDFDTYSNERLNFVFSMYGADMGNLSVELNTSGTWTSIWHLDGNQGDDDPIWWTGESLDLSSYSGSLQIRFYYDRNGLSGFTGDVSLDQISIATPLTITDSATYANIWTNTMINCSEYPGIYIEPYYCFSSLDSRAVITSDAQDSCDVLI